MRTWLTVLSFALAGSLLPAIGGCAVSCPAALLTGVLVEQSNELAVAVDGVNTVERVVWPFGYRVEKQGNRLVLLDLIGTVRASAGDRVRLGGGELPTADGWTVCGMLEVEPRST